MTSNSFYKVVFFNSDDSLRDYHKFPIHFPTNGEQVESENHAFKNQHYLFN